MNLLLDTSAFLWYLTADPRLPPAVVAAVRSDDNQVWLSVASFWEITIKWQIGRLPLPEPPAGYIPGQRRRHGIQSLDLDEDSITHLPKLPMLHKDPFDRALICQAIQHHLELVTDAQAIKQYPVRTWWG